MIINYQSSTLTTIEKLLHEEEVRFNEATRMKAETDILKLIEQEIKVLKAKLSSQSREFITGEALNY